MFYDWDDVRSPLVLRQRDMLEMPVSNMLPLVKNEVVRRYDSGKSYLNERETVLDYEETFPDTSRRRTFFAFSKPILPGSVQVTITGTADALRQVTRSGVTVTFEPESTSTPVTIEVKAKPLTPSVSDGTTVVNASGTEDDMLDNPLVNSATQEVLAEYRGHYLSNTRRSYDISYRGDPSIQVYDVMRVELPFIGVKPCIVLETEFTFDGAFRGRLFVRVNEAAEYDTQSAVCGIAVAGDALCGLDSV